MSILDPSTAALTMLTEDPFFDEGQVAAAAFLASTAAGPWTPTATTFGASSSGLRTPNWRSSKPSAPTSSCTAPQWRSVSSPLRP